MGFLPRGIAATGQRDGLPIPYEADEELTHPQDRGRRPHRWWNRRRGGAIVALIALATAGGLLLIGALQSRETGPPAALNVTSDPPGAAILLDGRAAGTTPAVIPTRAGDHRLTLALAGYADVTIVASAETSRDVAVGADLWRAVPQVRRIRPPLPGTTIDDVEFLADGRLALTILLPPGEERQAWLVEESGVMRRIGPSAVRGALAISPAGDRVAWLAEPDRTGDRATYRGSFNPTEVRIGPAEGGDPAGTRHWTLPNSVGGLDDERLVDLRWAPDGGGLLVVTEGEAQNGGSRFRLLWLDPGDGPDAATARDLIVLPSEIVPGSYAWRADGSQVAFLTRDGGRTTLCLLGTERDGAPPLFRYLADVTGEGGTTTPFPPIAWEPGGRRVAYIAPLEPAPAGWGSATRATALLIDDLAGGPGARRAEGAGTGPLWRADGAILTFIRLKSSQPPLLRRFGPGEGSVTADGGAAPGDDGAPLPLPAANPDGARWDRARARAIVALRPPGGADGYEYWLAAWR